MQRRPVPVGLWIATTNSVTGREKNGGTAAGGAEEATGPLPAPASLSCRPAEGFSQQPPRNRVIRPKGLVERGAGLRLTARQRLRMRLLRREEGAGALPAARPVALARAPQEPVDRQRSLASPQRRHVARHDADGEVLRHLTPNVCVADRAKCSESADCICQRLGQAASGGGEGGEGGGEGGSEGDEGDECRRERNAPRREEAESAGRGEREQRERERVGRRPKGWLEGAVVGARLCTAAAVKRRRSHNSPQPPSGPAQRKG